MKRERGYSVYIYLQHVLGGLGSSVVLRSSLQVVLILLAVHILVDGFAEKAVWLLANGAHKLIDFVLDEAEPLAVSVSAVEAIGVSILG